MSHNMYYSSWLNGLCAFPQLWSVCLWAYQSVACFGRAERDCQVGVEGWGGSASLCQACVDNLLR